MIVDEYSFGFMGIGVIGPCNALKPVGLGPLDRVTETLTEKRLAGMFPMFSII